MAHQGFVVTDYAGSIIVPDCIFQSHLKKALLHNAPTVILFVIEAISFVRKYIKQLINLKVDCGCV